MDFTNMIENTISQYFFDLRNVVVITKKPQNITGFFFLLQSMELLILSKLKWDLTAITSYDYLDYMINDTITPKVSQPILITSTPKPTTLVQTNNSSKLFEQQSSNSQLESKVRRNTEKLVTLCATDETFMSMPPSLVAASALVTAIEQDPTVTNNFNLNQIVNNIRDLTKLEIVSILSKIHTLIFD